MTEQSGSVGVGGSELAKPHIVFIASREPSYPRVELILRGLQQHGTVTAIVSERRGYSARIASVLTRFVWLLLSGQLRHCELIVVGFLAQPIFPLIRLLWRKPVISDAFFSLHDTLVNDKAQVAADSLVSRIGYWLDGKLLRESDYVLSDTESHAEYFRSKWGAVVPIRPVPASADDSTFERLGASSLESGRCDVLFWGGYIPLQGVEIILHSAALLRAEPFHFRLVGDGQTYRNCRAVADDLELENVEFLGWQTPPQLVSLAEDSHLLLGIFGTTAKAQRVIPNKAFQALALGKPLITADSPAARELLCDGQDCLLVPSGDPEALANRIRWAAENYQEALAIGRRGYDTFIREASPACVAGALGDVLKQVKGAHL